MTDIDRALKARPGCCAPAGFIRVVLWIFELSLTRRSACRPAETTPPGGTATPLPPDIPPRREGE